MDDEVSSPRFDFPSSSTNINEDHPINPQPQRQRLLDAYEEACTEYVAVANAHNGSTLQAAKYLRDTAENLVMFIDDLDLDARKREDILLMFETAKLAVQDLTGGKIRKFDTGYRSYQRRNSSGAERKPARPNYHTRARLAEGYGVRNNGRRSTSPAQDRGYYRDDPRGRSSPPGPRYPPQYSNLERYHPRDEPVHQAYEPRDGQVRQFKEPVRRESVRGTQDRLDSQRGSYRLPSEHPSATYPYSMGAYEVRAPDYRAGDEYRVRDYQSGVYRLEGNSINTTTSYTENEFKGRNKGRGHSGIPYGYNQDRQVDSYKPGQS
jgi:hypothetical protein